DAALIDQLLNARDAIVVGLDEVGLGGSSRFDGVGVDGSLPENPVAVEIVLTFENPFLNLDEFFADDKALPLRVRAASQRREEPLARILDRERPGAQRGEISAHELSLAFAHQAGIDVGSVDAFLPQ